MRRKILNLKDVAKIFHRMKVKLMDEAHHWYDVWNDLGHLHDLLGRRGHTDLGIGNSEMVAEVFRIH